MRNIIVAGTGTGVGKTIVSAILMTALNGNYWKPIQCGDSDVEVIKNLIDCPKNRIHPSNYSFKNPLSPHHASRLEKKVIDIEKIKPPLTDRPLIIESVGGLLVPLNSETLTLDLFSSWNIPWIVVSNHYLGSINHTLLTLEILKQKQIQVHSIVFNGEPNPDSEAIILHFSKMPCLGRILPEPFLNASTIKKYATEWKKWL